MIYNFRNEIEIHSNIRITQKLVYNRLTHATKKILYLSNSSLKTLILRLKKPNLTLKIPTLRLNLPSPET